MKENNDSRNSSIELLRIISMMGVVVLHYNNAGIGGGFKYVTEGSINQYFLYFTENLSICAVNLFIMISAYFLCMTQKRKIIKVVELIIEVIVFREAFYIFGCLLDGGKISIKSIMVCLLPVNYFVILYIALYFISPYINICIKSLSKRDFRKLVITVLLLFSVWTIAVDFIENILGISLNGLSTIGMYGSQYGYCIVNFVLVYLIGAYIRQYGGSINKKKSLIAIVLLIFTLYVMSIFEHKIGLPRTTTWNYNNPLIVFLSAFIILLFTQLEMKSKVINELAKGCFTCYLFHEAFMAHLGIQNVVTSSLLILIVHQFVSAIGLFMISYIVYKIYSFCSGWFIRLLTCFCNKSDVFINLDM